MNKGERSEKTLQIVADRKNGIPVRDIAKKYGVSDTYVYHVCTGEYGWYHRPLTEQDCVYPNLRDWFNQNGMSRGRFLRFLGYSYHSGNIHKLNNILKGVSYPRKDYIDNMMKVTGMTYEEMFFRGDD